MHWANRAEAEIEKDYEEGHISEQEYKAAMRELWDELEAEIEIVAQQARDGYY